MKYALFAFLLTGCLLSSEPTTTTRDYSFDPACLHEDSTTTTFTDTAEVETRNMSCTIDPSDPRPLPAPTPRK